MPIPKSAFIDPVKSCLSRYLSRIGSFGFRLVVYFHFGTATSLSFSWINSAILRMSYWYKLNSTSFKVPIILILSQLLVSLCSWRPGHGYLNRLQRGNIWVQTWRSTVFTNYCKCYCTQLKINMYKTRKDLSVPLRYRVQYSTIQRREKLTSIDNFHSANFVDNFVEVFRREARCLPVRTLLWPKSDN